MRLFSHIQIQTISWCNRSCAFCPSGKFPVDKKAMPLELWHRIIRNLSALSFKGRLSPYLMNEPLLDKRMVQLVEYARKWLPDAEMFINTNGDALSRGLASALLSAGLNEIIINAYDDRVQVKELQEIAEIDDRISVHDQTHWERSFLKQKGEEKITNRAGNTPGCRQLAEPLNMMCERPFIQMYINYLGQAVLCCQDWRFQVVMGDVTNARLEDIWESERYQAYREKLGRWDRDMPLCRTCDYHGSGEDWKPKKRGLWNLLVSR